MSSFEVFVIWFVSFLVFLLMLFISYKIGYKLGIKKALYRTTYFILSVIFAFTLSPTLNYELFKLDLSDLKIKLTYKEETFYTIADYIEEVIVHSDFLNDIYKYFPSLKNLFMDFPEVVLAPITFVILFVVFIAAWMPLYLYLSYKRKRRILYDRQEKRSHNVWAGVISAVQCVFLMSIILTPVNGFNRIYHTAMEDTLDEEYDSLCDEVEALNKYSKYCYLIDAYDATVFAHFGSSKSINGYMFDSLTRISYDGGYTSVAEEATLIMKSSIVLDQSGLFSALSKGDDVIPMELIINNNLSDSDIDVIIETISNSKYSSDLLLELGDLVVNTLDDLLSRYLGYEGFALDYSMSNEEIISEIKVALKAIKFLSGSELLKQILDVKDIVENFVNNYPMYELDDIGVFSFIVDLVNAFDIDDFIKFSDYLFESCIFNKIVPHVIDEFLGEFGFKFVQYEGDVKKILLAFMEFGKLVKKYQPADFFTFIVQLSDEELQLFAGLCVEILNSEETKYFGDFVFGAAFADFDVYSLENILAIDNWDEEIYGIREICYIMHDYRSKNEIDISALVDFALNSDYKVADIFLSIFQRNLDYFVKLILTGGEF